MSASLVIAGSARDGLVVVRSAFWGFQACGYFNGEEAVVVDPGIEPEDIELLRTTLAGHGAKTITHVLVTHSHHDHIRGWHHFPDARIVMPRVAATRSLKMSSSIRSARS